MAKQTWNNPIDKSVDWGGDATTGNLPVSGEQVQKFIKETFDKKAGVFHYDNTNNRYLVFADASTRDEFLLDPTKTDLVLGTFDAPFNYTAEINLTSAAYNAVFLGSTGNYIDFTFDIKNKQGASTGENVTVTYTFIRNAVRQTVTETRKFGDAVHFNIDKYLGEGTNTIVVGVTGQTSLAATTVAITYQVVNLKIEDDLDIAKAYNLSGSTQLVEVPFTVSGYGTKVVEWYLDGEMLPFVKAEDEVVDVIATRTKNIPLANLQQGTHSLQIRAYSLVNGEKFYTDTLYRDIIVYTGANSNIIIGVAVTIPRAYGLLGANDSVTIYDMVQYVPYTLRFATYSPSNAANTEVTITLGGSVKGVVNSSNGIENEFILTSTSSGDMVLNLSASGISKDITTIVQKTDMNIQEITSGLVLDFVASGKTNNSPDRDTWSDGTYTGTLAGFNWNNTSGWVGGRLEMNAGASFAINLAPLDGSPTNTGKTIEIEWSTKNVTNDNAVICDLRGEDGVGILITATKVSMTSADGVVVETEYKSDENVRIGFVINKATGSTNKRLSFIYANGIISRAEQWSETDSYASDKTILFTASEEAEVSLKSILIYDAALTSDNMLNNYTLYRDTIAEMMAVYDRNDVYEEGTVTFSPEKMMNRLPVMIVTGDIPTLENTSDKDTQIVVDIDYYNGDLSFTMKNAAMRPQGTSSMGYPKKNFRIYTQKVANTEVYDSTGKPIADKLYSFKKGAQPVNCWCLKADYAESSGTHNTGIARLWNEALYNAQIDGEYKLRTEAQKKATEAGYPYDVRTTIDGFPILLFYRPNANDDLIFIGKYNFNNDKSTESVFGFKGIPDFDNSKMQCWEVLNNGNALALFTSVEGFDSNWSEAFESRYPDTKTPYTGDLKAFCEWMTSVSQEDFATEKWQHLNVYMMAAYWVYLMRHAAADQFVKNAMFTSEDGQHFYYILYDNDTINGLINTGRLRIKPTDDRQTVDETGSYVFAGHDSRLWNMLEADDEFKDIVSAVDNALYSAGISYANTIRIFDEEQADKWVEKVYNQDAQYKYVGPYVEKGIDNLFMLQGKRDLHRRWWLAKRFSIYDAKYVSGSYKSQAIEIKCLNGTEAGQKFSIVAGYPLDYGYGINNIPRDFGVSLEVGDAYEFTTEEVVNLGDPVRIYGAPNIAEIDFSKMSDRLAVVTIANVYDENLGTKLAKLVLGNASKANYEVKEISGLKQAEVLEYLDIQGMTKINSLDLSNHKYFKTLKAKGSGVSSIAFAKGAPVEKLELPSSMRVLSLEQLPYLTTDGIAFENIANLAGMTIVACPNLSNDFDLVYNWVSNKTTGDANCYLIMDGVNWSGVSGDQMLKIASLGTVTLKGKVELTDITREQGDVLLRVFGESVFDENSEFFIDAPWTLSLSGPDSLLEGETAQYKAEIYPPIDGEIRYFLSQNRQGCSVDMTTGFLTTKENGLDTSDIVLRAEFTARNGEIVTKDKVVSVVKRTYPKNLLITGEPSLLDNVQFTLGWDTEGVNGEYDIEWLLSGLDNYYVVENHRENCVLSLYSTPLDTTHGTLTANIRKKVDGSVVSSVSIDVYHPITWLDNVTIEGTNNPMENNVYTWSTESTYSGMVKAEWTLTGEILEYFAIESQNTERCTLRMIAAPTEFAYGTLALTIKKGYNDEMLATDIKELGAIIEGIVITTKSNAPIQTALYEAGLVANETYSLQEEVEKITNEQINGLFSAYRDKITHFEEFRYFTGVTKVAGSLFMNCINLRDIQLPNTITSIGGYAFENSGLVNIDLVDGITNVGDYAFRNNQKLVNVTFPSTLQSIGFCSFMGCIALSRVQLKEGVKTLGYAAFSDCTSLSYAYIPSTVSSINSIAFDHNHRLIIDVSPKNESFSSVDGVLFNKDKTTLLTYAKDEFSPVYVIPEGTKTIGDNAFSDCSFLTSITLSSTLTKIQSNVFSGCTALVKINSLATSAPSATNSYTFGSGDTNYTGRNSYSAGTNFLYVPLNAKGYESGQWLDPLQNPDKCGFSIYGKLTINSNKSNAKFNVTYTTVDGTLKTITLGVGAAYLNDVKYDTEMTIVPIAMSGYTWDWESKSITYNGNAVFENNAYIYPTSVTISGASSIIGGNRETFKASVSPSNVDVDLTYTWSISGSSNASIVSTNENQCTIATNAVELEETFSLTCVVKSTNNIVTVQDTHDVKIMDKPNYITATYSIAKTTSETDLLYSSFDIPNIKYMEIDGKEVSPTRSHKFSSRGTHTVKFSLSTLSWAFTDVDTLVSINFNECNGALMTDMSRMFQECSALTSITWGACKFPNVTDLSRAFSGCFALTSIDLSPFEGAPITDLSSAFSSCYGLTSITWGACKFPNVTDLSSAFSGCRGLTSIDLSPFEGAPITDLNNTFSSCYGLTSITWGACKFPNVTDLSSAFSGCRGLTSIDLSPFEGAPITNLSIAFYDCFALTSIDLSPFKGAPITNLNSAFSGCRGLTSINLSPFEGAPITNLNNTFSSCSALTSIDLSPFKGAPITNLNNTFSSCSALTSIDLSPFEGAPITIFSNTFKGSKTLKSIAVPWVDAPTASSNTFGDETTNYVGRQSYSTGENRLLVPVGAKGYDAGYWLDPLQNPEKCGFTISYTL